MTGGIREFLQELFLEFARVANYYQVINVEKQGGVRVDVVVETRIGIRGSVSYGFNPLAECLVPVSGCLFEPIELPFQF